jgi:hypothetical protein
MRVPGDIVVGAFAAFALLSAAAVCGAAFTPAAAATPPSAPAPALRRAHGRKRERERKKERKRERERERERERGRKGTQRICKRQIKKASFEQKASDKYATCADALRGRTLKKHRRKQ